MKNLTYEDLVVYANERIKSKHRSILAFAREVKIQKKDGLSCYSPQNICNLLAIPSDGKKKIKSFYFLQQLFKLWNYELTQKVTRVTKVTINTDKELVM